LGKKDPQRREGQDNREQQARDEAEMVQDVLQRIRENGEVLAKDRPRGPEPGEDDQDPDDDLGPEKLFEERHAGGVGKSEVAGVSGLVDPP